MTTTVGDMSPDELRALIEAAIERKLSELLSDPDRGLVLEEAFAARLEAQQAEVAAGERGLSLEDVRRELSLD